MIFALDRADVSSAADVPCGLPARLANVHSSARMPRVLLAVQEQVPPWHAVPSVGGAGGVAVLSFGFDVP